MIEPAEVAGWFAGGSILAALGWLLVRNAGSRWRKTNRRGRTIPVTLGWAFAIGAAGIALVVADQIRAVGVRDSQAGELLGAAVVFVAGVVDDGFGGTVRGLRGHLRALLGGHLTTGGVKLGAAVLAAAITVAWTPRDHLWADLLALVAIAGCTNVWNGLDVAPGRALKGFVVVAVVLLVVDLKAFLLVCTGAAVTTLVPDLRERGMLGRFGREPPRLPRRGGDRPAPPGGMAGPGRGHRDRAQRPRRDGDLHEDDRRDRPPPMVRSSRTHAGSNFVSPTGGLVHDVC